MKRNWINFAVDALTAAALLALALTGLILRYTLPPRSGEVRNLWSLTRHQWGSVHFWLAVSVGVLILIHLWLHWTWVTCMLARAVTRRPQTRPITRNVLGVAALALLVGINVGFVWWTQSIVAANHGPFTGEGHERHRDAADPPGHGDHDDALPPQLGQRTLAEIEQLTGVAPADLLAELGLPPDTPPDEQLGRLRNRHALEMDAIRTAIAKLRDAQ